MGNGPGRPPKNGERYPSGQLKPEIAPAQLARLRTAVEHGLADPRFGSQVGRLFLQRIFSAGEMSIALRVGEIYGRYEGNNGMSRLVHSPSYEIGLRGAGSSETTPDALARYEADREAWLALQEEFDTYPPRQATRLRAMIEALCVEDQPISSIHIEDIKRVLHRLARILMAARPRGKRRRRAALVVVGKDHRAAPQDNVATPARTPIRVDHEREAWLKVQRKLCPKLDDGQLAEAYEIFVAMKEREAFNAQKPATRR